MKVKMLKSHDGARAGDVVSFENPSQASALIAARKAELYDKEKHGHPGEDGRHGNPVEAEVPATKPAWLK